MYDKLVSEVKMKTILLIASLFLTACAGSGGGGSSGGAGNGTPDFTLRSYSVICLGGAPGNHEAVIRQVCNQNASSGFRDETSTLQLPNGTAGGVACGDVFNYSATIQNNAPYRLICGFQINDVTQTQVTIPALGSQTFSNGYVPWKKQINKKK